MSTQAQSSSPFARLSRLAFPFKSSPSSPLNSAPPPEDWYIPYHGPYEPPKDGRNTDSWGHLVSGWLMEHDGEQQQRAPRARAASNASRPSGEDHKRGATRVQASFIKLDQAGGVGAVPTPARPRRSQEAPVHHRASLASILSFGNKKTHRLQHSPSVGTLRDRERDDGPVPAVPQDARQESNSQPAFPRRHPYAYATPAPPTPLSSPVVAAPPAKTPSTSKFSVQLLEPLARKPSAPAYLLPARRPSRLSLKASMSTPNLRAATGTGATLPKGKQRWLAAETWCDALILPRPRFAMQVDGADGSSGRIVSPPSSPIWPSEATPPAERPTLSVDRLGGDKGKTLKKSQSAIQLSTRPPPPSPPRPRVQAVGTENARRWQPQPQPQPQAGPSTAAVVNPAVGPATVTIAQPTPERADTHLKPFRPKSWALDDLALPSPVPSLAKVLEDGRKLEEDRKTWQKEAAKSFAGQRARSVSRARSKSIGHRATSHAREPSALDALAEVTLLGSQKRRPTVHVRIRPPRSDGHTSSGGGTNTITGTGTGTGTGLGTFTSSSHAHGQTRSRSHGHSASLGSISNARSDESFMWNPGHGRNHSLGKSTLRIIRTTATTAAGFCGINGAQSDEEGQKGRTYVVSEKAAAMEEALRHDGTKVIHLRDQVMRERPNRDNVVVITPPLSGNLSVGSGGVHGVSPTPSGQSTSVEGIGIAITSPPVQEDAFEQEPIRIPAHPYAQGREAYPYYQHAQGRAPILPSARNRAATLGLTGGPVGEEGATKHRQPVKVHPYSPYTPVQHPYSGNNGAEPGPSTHLRPRPTKSYTSPSPRSTMYAAIDPGDIREIRPDDIQYSPYISTPPIRIHEIPPSNAAGGSRSGHPYSNGPASNRRSEWGFADALTHTLERRDSPDSGLGTSEAHEIPAMPDRPVFARVVEDSEDMVVISPDEDIAEEMEFLHPHSRSGSEAAIMSRRPRMTREATQASSNHTLASSPMDSIDPSTFMQEPSAGERSFHSSGSSPGVVSQQSSPPLSPRPITSTDDLDRFRDLFYRPPASRTSSSDDSRPPLSRRPSGSIPIELGVRSTRSLSGLTTLARQLSVNLEEMEEHEHALEDDEVGRASPMWGARYGGLSGQRPEDLGPDPPGVLSGSSSRSGYRRDDTQSPLRLPIDEDLVLSQPVDIVPEDVESSRASSMLELPMADLQNLRVRETGASHTPIAFTPPKRFSTHLTEMDYPAEPTSASPPDDRPLRHASQHSSLGVPQSSDPARSSFMTSTSGMSRLSDFPAPPNQITAGHLSILNAYYRDSTREPAEDEDASRPGLVREASQATFGRQQMGEAL